MFGPRDLRPWLAVFFALAISAPSTVLADEPKATSGPGGWDYVIPVGSMLGANIAFWGTARYVLDEKFAYIGPGSMADNFDEGFHWDADTFRTNQVGHPYQGGLYHNGARAAGFGFWGAIPYTMLGSLQWEMFMETTQPSYNDVITTTIGGVALGEVLFRLSSAVLDESSTGVERVAREGGALALSPIHGLGRLLSGAATRRGAGEQKTPMATRLAVGVDELRPADIEQGTLTLGIDTRIIHGTFADEGEPFAPFDWFMVGVGFNYSAPDFYAAQLDITGLLARWGVGCGQDNQCAWGPMLHYDYYDSELFKVGTSTVGATALGRFDLGWWSLELFAELDLGVVALGGFDSPYADRFGRNYNLGSGGFARTILALTKPNWFQLRSISSRYYVRTVHGAYGHEVAGISRLELEIPVYDGLGISAGSVVYDRIGVPESHDTVTSSHVASQLQLVWRP